jgi:putative molybdopterin biosynthesis protein
VVIPTGDEVKPIGSSLGPGGVLDTNSLMLTEFAHSLGCTAHTTPIAPDHPGAIASEITTAAEIADLVLVIAGSSAGRDDHTASVLATLGKVAVHGVAMRPGHPVVLGVVDLAHPVPVIGVPGYPVAAAQVFRSFAAPMIAQLQGRRNVCPDTVQATVVGEVASPPRVHDHILVELRREAGALTAIPVGRGAGALSSLMRADGVICVPLGVDGLTTGQNATVELLDRSTPTR